MHISNSRLLPGRTLPEQVDGPSCAIMCSRIPNMGQSSKRPHLDVTNDRTPDETVLH